MKKLVSACVSAVLAVSTLSMGLFAGAAELSEVGTIGEKGLPSRFAGKEDQLSQKYKAAYQWAIQLHAQKQNDGNFNFGNASGEFLHNWSGTDPNDQVYEICNQDFDSGNSTASGSFSYNNWAALVCTNPDTLEVIVMRDAAAEYYAKGGGVNNWQTSDPITNQYWRMEGGIPVAYQQFKNGYLRSEEGESWYTDFYSKIDLDADYVEPPQAPPAYGDIYEINADGCSWENPKYFPEDQKGNIVDGGTTSLPKPQQPGGNDNNPGGNPGGTITDPTDPNFDPNAVGGDQTPGEQTPDGQTPDGQTPDGENPEGTGSDTAALTSGTASGNKANANANKDNKGGANTVRKMNVGATVGIIGGAVVVLGGGAFCLYWFVLRKKKVAEGAGAAAADAPQTEDKPEEKSEK
ncbi:MAG: hypothetical protein HFE86_08720 [Clostridiales bacterium]|nr:hypothetical protein [Clostridiales bacterium]